MSDLLSQDEINALLSAFDSAKPDDKGAQSERRQREVRLYDFSRPDRFSKEHLRTVNTIHANFAGNLTTTLTNMYQVPTHVDLISVDQVSYKDYLASIPSKTMLAEVVAQPLNADLLFEVNTSIVGIWVDYLCGSNPDVTPAPSELTPIDLAMAKKVLNSCLQVYSDAWADVVELQSEIRRMVNSEKYDGTLLPSETVLACSFEINSGQSVGMMSICIPAAGIEAVLPALASKKTTRQSSRRQTEADAAFIRSALGEVSIPVCAILGTTSIPFSDAVNLEIGDIIRTTRRVDDEIELWVGEGQMYNCTPGLKGNNIAAMISGTAMPTGTVIAEHGQAAPVEIPQEIAA